MAWAPHLVAPTDLSETTITHCRHFHTSLPTSYQPSSHRIIWAPNGVDYLDLYYFECFITLIPPVFRIG